MLLIAPAGAPAPAADSPAAGAFPLGRVVPLGDPAACVLGGGWSAREDWGVWSDGPTAALTFRIDPAKTNDLLLTVSAQSFPAEGQTVFVEAGGRRLETWRLRGVTGDYRARIPRGLAGRTELNVVLAVERPTAPHDLGPSDDTRRLGVGLTSVRLDEVP